MHVFCLLRFTSVKLSDCLVIIVCPVVTLSLVDWSSSEHYANSLQPTTGATSVAFLCPAQFFAEALFCTVSSVNCEPKQLADEASRFHLGRQRQHSVVICSGALLFSTRVLCPSLVTLCSHKSGRCTVELYHAVPAEGNGNLQTLICVLVARPRRCLTLSNPVP